MNTKTVPFWALASFQNKHELRVMVFGYDTDLWPFAGLNQTRVRDVARFLLVQIRNERREENLLRKPLVFMD